MMRPPRRRTGCSFPAVAAYWKPDLIARIASGSGHCVFTRSRQGVWLSALWHFPREDLVAASSHNRPIKTDVARPAAADCRFVAGSGTLSWSETENLPLAVSWTIRRIRSERIERNSGDAMRELTHFDETGASRMVDVSGKEPTQTDGPGQWQGHDGAGDSFLDTGSGDWPRETFSKWPGWPASWRPSEPGN